MCGIIKDKLSEYPTRTFQDNFQRCLVENTRGELKQSSGRGCHYTLRTLTSG